MIEQAKIAVLIDAENISRKYIKLIMHEVSNYGLPTYKRIYGDFTTPSVMSWQNQLRDYALTPIFQFNYTQGKNASDSALIIDAMDILYSGNVDGFCIVTSDSDFTKLAIRLRESGMMVIGMGEQKTPNSLVSACETFKYLDLLYQAESIEEEAPESDEASKPVAGQKRGSKDRDAVTEEQDTVGNSIPSREQMGNEIISIIGANSSNNEWVFLATIGNVLQKRVPGFDPRNYKCRKLRDFVESFDCFEVKDVPDQHDEFIKIVYVKMKE
ncbi:MAG: NYN domain-containing protein [Lachnospiraceae bacterium]